LQSIKIIKEKMKTLTRNKAARQLGVTSNHLIYWENEQKLKPEKMRIGDITLVLYTPELLERAKKLLFSGKRRKREKK